MAEHGRVIAVGDELLGDEFAEDTAAGATVLQLVDVADFDEAGGKVRIGGVVVDYLTVDDQAATMTLAAALAADADAGDHLDAWDQATNTAAIDRIASVVFDGQTDGEAIECVVAQHLRRELPPGIRGEIGESVLINPEGDEWRVIDVLGAEEQAATKFWVDTFVVASPGSQDLALTWEPILHSEDVYWHPDGGSGVHLRGDEWSRAGSVITAPDVPGDVEAGDVYIVEYAYLPGASATTIAPDPLDVPIGSDWLYATGLGSSTTYAATAFDDSAWAMGSTPMGFGAGSFGVTLAPLSNVWQRIHVTTTGGDLEFNGGHDDTAKVYIDGVEVYSGAAFANPVTFTETGVPAGDHVIAVYGTDTGGGGMYVGWAIEELA